MKVANESKGKKLDKKFPILRTRTPKRISKDLRFFNSLECRLKESGYLQIEPECFIKLLKFGYIPRYDNQRTMLTGNQVGIGKLIGRFDIVIWTSFDGIEKKFSSPYGSFWVDIIDKRFPIAKPLYCFKLYRGILSNYDHDRIAGAIEMIDEVCAHLDQKLPKLSYRSLSKKVKRFFEPFADKSNFYSYDALKTVSFLTDQQKSIFINLVRGRYYYWRQKVSVDGVQKIVTFRHSEKNRRTMKKNFRIVKEMKWLGKMSFFRKIKD